MGAWNGLERHYVISGALFGAISVVHNMLLWLAKRNPTLNNGLQHPVIAFLGEF
jgi:membrane protein involved in D-alanine export